MQTLPDAAGRPPLSSITRVRSPLPGADPLTAPNSNDSAMMNLAEVLAHRIRNLLASVEGHTHLLTDTLPPGEQREMTRRILESTARIEHILADLQRFSRPIEPLLRPVHVGSLLDELAFAFDGADLARLETDADGHDDIVFEVDAHLLRQCLLILLQNALEATPAGPVRLRVARGEDPASVCFSVWNEGGLPPGTNGEKLFEPFFTTKVYNLGIGLPMARRIAQAHGGRLWITSGPEVEGTCFTLALPVR